MLIHILLVILGFGLLIKGADWFVDGAVGLARRSGMSDLAIGLTIVAFGTSAPELVVNLNAMLQGHHEMVLANVIGSNNFNIFVIIGITGLIYPIMVRSSTVWKEIPFSLAAIGLIYFLCRDGSLAASGNLSRMDAIAMLLLFLGFMFYIARNLKTETGSEEREKVKISPVRIASFLVLGLVGLVLGGRIVVDNAVSLAESLGLSEKIIGLTVVAVGTSLPELATSLIAAFKKNSDIAVGNIIGSNIFNLLLVLGISSLVGPISYHEGFDVDFALTAIGTIIVFLAMFTGKKGVLDRWEGGVLLLTFLVYTGYLVSAEIS